MTLRFSLAAGIVVGLVLGAARGALFLTFFGFWGGLMWLLLLGGPIGLALAARKKRAGAAITFAIGIAAGIMPGAFYDWRSERLRGTELWFPISLAFLLGLMLSPMVAAIRRSKSNAPVI